MRVGDKVTIFLSCECGEKAPVPARVVYIHPQRRYYVAEFTIDGRTAREAYPCPDRGTEKERRTQHENNMRDESQGRRWQNRHR
jgi:hypothetical protein